MEGLGNIMPLVLISAAVAALIYLVVLSKLGIIKTKRLVFVRFPEFAKFTMLLGTRKYAKIVSGVLHNALWDQHDVIEFLARTKCPVEVIFGPHLCLHSMRLLKAAKENPNIRMFQIKPETWPGLSESTKIEKQVNNKTHFINIDGLHCYIEQPHPEDGFSGGFEHVNDPILCAKLEKEFSKLMSYCVEVDRNRIVDSVGERNIYTTRKDGTWGYAGEEDMKEMKLFLEES